MYKAVLDSLGVKQVLTQNGKMKKSSQGDTALYNWTIPAFKSQDGTITCPNASKCAIGCYAKQGSYVWTNTMKSHQNKLDLTRHSDFVPIMVQAIEAKLKTNKRKSKKTLIRIHDAGDFYSLDYTLSWFRVMNTLKNESSLSFYAYTKEVDRFKSLKTNYSTIYPKNFTVIFSLGGKQDSLIDQNTDRHSKVFQSETDLIEQGYIDASHDDTLALTDNPKIGLIYHGTKGYNKTAWSKVK
jgi:hypothetical protein